MNKGQECIKRPNPFACNGYPGFVIAKVHSFKVKRLVPRLSLVSLSTSTFRCIRDCCIFLDTTTTFYVYIYLRFLATFFTCLNHELSMHACASRKRWSDFEHFWFLILNPPKQGGLFQSLCRVEHLIILAWRVIGVALNLFQVPDIIRLIPGITRHLKLLSSGKADHTDYSPITFLLLFLTHPHTLTHTHTLHITYMDRCALYGQRTFCSELQSEDKAVMEQIYFWALNGLVPILWSRSSWMIFNGLKPDCSISFWTTPSF